MRWFCCRRERERVVEDIRRPVYACLLHRKRFVLRFRPLLSASSTSSDGRRARSLGAPKRRCGLGAIQRRVAARSARLSRACNDRFLITGCRDSHSLCRPSHGQLRLVGMTIAYSPRLNVPRGCESLQLKLSSPQDQRDCWKEVAVAVQKHVNANINGPVLMTHQPLSSFALRTRLFAGRSGSRTLMGGWWLRFHHEVRELPNSIRAKASPEARRYLPRPHVRCQSDRSLEEEEPLLLQSVEELGPL